MRRFPQVRIVTPELGAQPTSAAAVFPETPALLQRHQVGPSVDSDKDAPERANQFPAHEPAAAALPARQSATPELIEAEIRTPARRRAATQVLRREKLY